MKLVGFRQSLRSTLEWTLRPFTFEESAQRSLSSVVAAVRVLFGLLIVHQSVDIYGFAILAEGGASSVRFGAGIVAIGGFMVTVGFMTPLVLLLFLLYFAYWPLVFNLGTHVSVILVWGLLLLGGGRTYSIDALFLRIKAIRQRIAPLYALAVDYTPWNVACVRFALMFMFWGVCVSAMFGHTGDSYWLNGTVLQVAFTTPYLTDYYDLAITARESSPKLYMAFFWGALAVQAFWESFLILLMYSRWTRIFVIVQGLGFFLISLILLNLQYLPLIELLLWGLLFGPLALAWLRPVFVRRLKGLHRSSSAQASFGFSQAEPSPSLGSRLLPGVTVAIVLAAVLQVATAPDLVPTFWAARTAWWHAQGLGVFKLLGQRPVNVFNKTDLEMSSVWFVLHEIDPASGQHLRLVPLYDDLGGRLDYMRNDLLYLHSIRWQRSPSTLKFVAGDPARPTPITMSIVRKVAMLDAALTATSRPRLYEVLFFSRDLVTDHLLARWSEPRPGGRFRLAVREEDLETANAEAWYTFDLPPGHADITGRERRTSSGLAVR